MSQPLVSVITPAYNGSSTIRESLDSVIQQTFTDYEIIVVDDASTDNTAQVVETYGDNVRLIRRENNSGICEIARSQGISAARGKYCAFIDQDDLWTPEKLEKQIAFMEAHPDIPLSHTYMNVIDEHGVISEIRHEGAIPPTGPCAKEILEHCFITISSIVVRGTLWRDAWNVETLREPNSDIEYFLSLLQQFPAGFGFIPEVLGSYRRWSESISRQDWRRGPEDVNALERVYGTSCWHGLVTDTEMKQIISQAYLKNAEHHRHGGHPDRSIYFSKKGLRYSGSNLPLLASLTKAIIQRSLTGIKK